MKVFAYAALAIIALGFAYSHPSNGQATVINSGDGFPIGISDGRAFFVVRDSVGWLACGAYAAGGNTVVDCDKVHQ